MAPGKRMKWGSEEEKNATLSMSSWYKVKANKKDILRIVGDLYQIDAHDIQGEKFARLLCSKVTSNRCAVCDNARRIPGHKAKTLYAVKVLHLTEEIKGGKPKPVIELKAWRFTSKIKSLLSEINDLVDGNIHKVDIMVRLESDSPDAEQYQKVLLRENMKSVMYKKLKENEKYAKLIKKALSEDSMKDIESELFPDFETVASQLSSIADIEFEEESVGADFDDDFEDETTTSIDDDEDEEDEEEPPKKNKKKSGKKKKAAPVDEEEDSGDDFDDLFE